MKYAKTFSTVLALLFSVSALAGQPEFIPATQKYSDAGAKPATGRAGSAKVSARALLGSDYFTTLETSTGAFNSTAPGNLDKLQVKLTHGRKQQTLNYTNLSNGGFVSLPFEGLLRGDSVQVQANVSGIDPHRTGVVTLQTPVLLRPDFQVTGIDAPTEARANEVVLISANVREANGDLAVDATVVVEVDGVEVDRAEPIHLAPSASTSIPFPLEFDSDGEKTITVSARNVDPGDYDLSNNSFSVKIIVKSALPMTKVELSAQEREVLTTQRVTDPTEDRTTTQKLIDSSATFIGYTGALNLSNTELRVQHFSGALATEATFRPTAAAVARGSFSVTSNGHTAIFTPTFRWENGVKVPETRIQASRFSSNVIYFSHGWSYRYLGKQGTYYVFNESKESTVGAQGRYGSSYEVRVDVSDGRNAYEANPIVPLFLQEKTTPFNTCYTTVYGPTCVNYLSVEKKLVGSTPKN